MLRRSPRSRSLRALILAAALGLVWLRAPVARAEIDWPIRLPLPDLDVALGVSAGVGFAETREAGSVGGALAVEASLLDGVFGLHLGVHGQREGLATRLGVSLEATWWYLLMMGAGVRVGAMTDDGGPGVPDTTVAFTIIVAIPVPIWSLDEGRKGAIVVVPYGRPGLRLGADEEISGYHEVGLMLKWTSFGY